MRGGGGKVNSPVGNDACGDRRSSRGFVIQTPMDFVSDAKNTNVFPWLLNCVALTSSQTLRSASDQALCGRVETAEGMPKNNA